MAHPSAQKSTIVRSIVRTTFRVLELAAPGLGGRIGNRVWFRLPPSAASSEHPTGPEGPRGQGFEVTLRQRVIRGWTWGDGPVVYLVHGWSGSAQQLAPFVAPLLAEGFQVVAFDGLSHGRSDAGENGAGSSDAVELGRSLDAVFTRFGPAQGVVAHSMGALSTVLALRDGWIGTERLVFIAPVTGVPDFVLRIRAELGFGDRIQRRMEALAQLRTGYPVGELDVALLAARIKRPPLLVVHDEQDRETPWEGSVRLVDTWTGARLHTTSGLGHRRVLADPGVGRLVAGFLAGRPVGPEQAPTATPSGREDSHRPVAAGSRD
jgi:pimeloyl-ACP methyl ester carboxylesterase